MLSRITGISPSCRVARAARAVALLGVLTLGLAGCFAAPGLSSPTGAAPPLDLSQPLPPPDQSKSMLTADDLFSIYQGVLSQYVDHVDDSRLILGALSGANAAAQDQGLLPVDTAILETAPLQLSGDPSADWAGFGDAYDLFAEKLEGRIDVGAVGQGAARGMLAALKDPLTTYLDKATMQAMRAAGDARVGVTLAPGDDGGPPIVRQVLSDGPAAQAGIAPGDAIQAVDGRDTAGENLSDVLTAMGGAQGTRVTLSIRSPGASQPRDVGVQRAQAAPEAVSSRTVDGVAQIQLHAFDAGTAAAVRRALTESADGGAHGWILDLRGNGEGSLDGAVDVASLFVGQQTVATEQDHGGRETTIRGTVPALDNQLPLVVLVDGATVGPAELLAAAVHDYGLGTIVGTPTAGRLGTPTVIGLSDGSAAEITTGRILSPSGQPLLGAGVPPDIAVATDPAGLAAGMDAAMDQAMAALR